MLHAANSSTTHARFLKLRNTCTMCIHTLVLHLLGLSIIFNLKNVYLSLLVTKFCENIPQNTFNILL